MLDGGQGTFGRALIAELKREWPGPHLVPVALTSAAAEAMGAGAAGDTLPAQLDSTGLIVVSWQMVVAEAGGGMASAGLANAVIASSARKLLVPTQADGWNWAGLEGGNESSMVQQTVRAVRQIIEGEAVRSPRSPVANIIISLFVALILLCILPLIVLALIYFR